MIDVLTKYKNQIQKCSQCGLCMAVCPLYKETKNDCTNARGILAMLNGVLKGHLELDNDIFEYLNLCTDCDKCKSFCPSEIDIASILKDIKTSIKH